MGMLTAVRQGQTHTDWKEISTVLVLIERGLELTL